MFWGEHDAQVAAVADSVIHNTVAHLRGKAHGGGQQAAEPRVLDSVGHK